ncbi:MAG: 1-acyl-sn-glycerol-3-phosphate acyltransferase [Leptospiraceae bacterium]|nr:1-acyl-sn-glycerol-3-phosphate acyltransferase [Leptospiraceae bacterium]MCP5510508.1 1-acyl-sn-glycerol-3-phosphate acyltransferase [Leptospiraceae bacterium]
MKEQFQVESWLLDLIESPIGEFIYKYFCRVSVTGIENVPSGGALITPNHPSIMDPSMLFLSTFKKAGRQIRFVAWAGLLEKEPYSKVLKAANVIPVNPPGATGSEEIKKAYPIMKTNKMVIESLKAGDWVGVFPEGTNHLVWDGNTLYPLQRGILIWSAMSGVPIIPVGLKNTQFIWPMLANIDLKDLNFQFWLNLPLLLPVKVEINFGKPIYVDRTVLKDPNRMDESLREIENSIRSLADLK